MSDTAYSKSRPKARPAPTRSADDYDDAPEQVAEEQPVVRAAGRPSVPTPASGRLARSCQYDQYEEYNVEDEGYEEEEVVTVGGSRALILGLMTVLVLAIFGLVGWLLLSRQATSGGPVTDVPTIVGFNPATSSENQVPAKGAFAPDFMWQENGKTVSLSSYRGNKPLFINFWGTWCPPCKAEMPEMQAFLGKYGKEMEMIGVSMAPRDTPEMVFDFVRANSYTWKFIHDGDYSVATRYQVISIPSSYFVGKDGTIKAVHVGAMNGAMMESYLQQAR